MVYLADAYRMQNKLFLTQKNRIPAGTPVRPEIARSSVLAGCGSRATEQNMTLARQYHSN